ncbi:MAG: M3 family oligoendopeptidase [Phycisphaerae bacterium]
MSREQSFDATPPPRRFLRPDADLGDWSAAAPYFDELRRRPLSSVGAVEEWLLDGSELQAGLEEARNVREVAMTCQTDDAAREQAYLKFIEAVQPKARVAWNELDRKLVAAPATAELPQARYGVLLRRIRNRVALYREENVRLATEDERLRTQFQKIAGAMTVMLDGQEQTLDQANRELELPDRARRQAAWEAVWERRLRDRGSLDEVFDAMVAVRHQMARNADCADYIEFAFRDMERFDYSPADCERFHATVERVCVPALRAMHAARRKRLSLTALRPWDLAVDPRSRPPLRPFETADALIAGCGRAFGRVDRAFGEQFEVMRRESLLDLSSRKGKAPGGYMTTFELRRLPFIFMNAVGVHRDVETLLHEGGHAFHAFATRNEPLCGYRSAPIEFCEVASMAMELLALDALDEFYSPADHDRARRQQFEGIVTFFPWMATIDGFQHWVYRHPRHTRGERTAAWLELRRRFGGLEEYAGHDDALAAQWQRQLHPFTVPMYYVEYGIAQLGALAVWCNARRDRQAAVQAYRAGLALGGSVPLPQLFATAGARLDFSAGAVEPLMRELTSELGRLPE